MCDPCRAKYSHRRWLWSGETVWFPMHRKICKWMFYFNLNSLCFPTFKLLSIRLILRHPNCMVQQVISRQLPASAGCRSVRVSCAAERLSPGEQLAGDRVAADQQPGRTQHTGSAAELGLLWAGRCQYCWGCDFVYTHKATLPVSNAPVPIPELLFFFQ